MSRFPIAAATLAGALLVSACVMSPKLAGTHTMMTRLSGFSQVPPVSSAATGSAETSYNMDTRVLKWSITYANLSGAPTGGHFHGPAMPGVNAPVALPFSGSLASPIIGNAVLTPAQATDLMAGRWYVNLHTAANPGGEIRGQVVVGN
ncbi:MAG: CHRD domain-containing protein [Rhodoferax sp.]|nr:CHRD domain-containing protein [Rhodoferax sp.]